MWKPISESDLQILIHEELAKCSAGQRDLFNRIKVNPYKVSIHRLGIVESVFVIAKLPDGVVYFEDVEEGFEIGNIREDGVIAMQGCSQFELRHVLELLGK